MLFIHIIISECIGCRVPIVPMFHLSTFRQSYCLTFFSTNYRQFACKYASLKWRVYSAQCWWPKTTCSYVLSRMVWMITVIVRMEIVCDGGCLEGGCLSGNCLEGDCLSGSCLEVGCLSGVDHGGNCPRTECNKQNSAFQCFAFASNWFILFIHLGIMSVFQ